MKIYSNRLRRTSMSVEKFYEIIILFLICLIIVLTLIYKLNLFEREKRVSYVITLAGDDHRLPKIIELFQRYAQMELIPFYGSRGVQQQTNSNSNSTSTRRTNRLTVGQRGLRETMKMFFQMTIQKNLDEVLIFQDDAIPHLNFSYLFQNLDQRCLDADLLLLGASIWHRKRSRWPTGKCFDADKSTFGAYGLLVKRKLFKPILNWLNDVEQITFDHMYKFLQIDGFTVRVAHPPFLVIMDVSHKSLINNHRSALQFNVEARAKIHDWHLNEYPVSMIEPKQ